MGGHTKGPAIWAPTSAVITLCAVHLRHLCFISCVHRCFLFVQCCFRAASRAAGPDGLLGAIERGKLGAVVTLSTGPAWKVDAPRGDRGASIGGYGAAAVAGTPSITIPIGESRGLPFGLTFMGPAFSEAQLIGYAYALEQMTGARRPPRFIPSLEAWGRP